MRGPLFDDQMLCAASIARRLAIGRRRCVAGRGLEEIIMFVRQVKAHFKPEKFELFNKRFEKEVIPMLQKQKGFRDELSFFDKEKDEAISLSFWDTKEYADKYARDLYPTIHTKMEDMLKDTPQVRFFGIVDMPTGGMRYCRPCFSSSLLTRPAGSVRLI
jgi:heme-degrading monooxygenase HmoA